MKNVVEIQTVHSTSVEAPAPTGVAVLTHDRRRLRRGAIELSDGRKVLIDLAEPRTLNPGDTLVLDDGEVVLVEAAMEDLYEIRARDPLHLTELAWHIGNRHLPAEILNDRMLILRDHVVKAMLEGLGAKVSELHCPFSPTRGAYAGSSEHNHHHHD